MKYLEELELGDILNEFVDEYTLWHLAADAGLKRGLSFTAYYHQEKIKPMVKGCHEIHYLNPIDRIVQMSFWLKGDMTVHNTKTFSEVVENLHLARLQGLVFFEGDEVTYSFHQDKKLLGKISGVVNQNNWFKQVGANKKIVNSFKTPPKVGVPITVTVQVTKDSPHREVTRGQLQQNKDLFLQVLANKYINGPYSMNMTPDQIKNLNLYPKRVSTLFVMVLNRKMLPLLKNPAERIEAEPGDQKTAQIIKNKLIEVENGRLPFTTY